MGTAFSLAIIAAIVSRFPSAQPRRARPAPTTPKIGSIPLPSVRTASPTRTPIATAIQPI
jgi:hypothetical protein